MIEGKKINLRLVASSDIPDFLELVSKISNRGEFWPVGLVAETHYKKRYDEDGMWGEQFGRMLIINKQDQISGEIFYFKTAQYIDGYEIGYQIFRPEDWGKGFTSEALWLFTDYLFKLKPLNRLQLCIDPGNIASRKVAEKCFYQKEGCMREAFFNRGKYEDMEIFSLLRREWEEKYS